MTRPRRAGLSLLEVMLATSILLGAIVVLGELARIGRINAVAARQQAEAQRLCETKLNEILIGSEPSTPHTEEPFVETTEWTYSVDRYATAYPGLFAVEVTVTQNLPDNKRPVTFTLARWTRDLADAKTSPPAPGADSTSAGDTPGPPSATLP